MFQWVTIIYLYARLWYIDLGHGLNVSRWDREKKVEIWERKRKGEGKRKRKLASGIKVKRKYSFSRQKVSIQESLKIPESLSSLGEKSPETSGKLIIVSRRKISRNSWKVKSAEVFSLQRISKSDRNHSRDHLISSGLYWACIISTISSVRNRIRFFQRKIIGLVSSAT